MACDRMVLAVVVGLLLTACRGPVAGAADGAVALPDPFNFGVDTKQLLLSVLDEQGRPINVERPDDIPLSLRARVMVVDLARSPEQRQADRFVFFADLTRPDADGRYTARPMSRYRRPVANATGPLAAAAGGVVLYSAPWCGFCKQAKAYLKQRGIAFVERDVEASATAQRELDAKLRAAHAAGGGVPVLDIGGQLVLGFDRARIDEALAKLKPGGAVEDAGGSGSGR